MDPMTQPNVVLTGFMGAGKTTVGRLLAAQLDYQFVDTDDWIVARAGRAIADIFRDDGERAFREMERLAAHHFSQTEGFVIATGGRLMLDQVNALLLGRGAHVFCLTAAPETILARVQDEAKRPLLNVPQPAQRIQALLNERAALYGRFPQIPTDNRTPQAVAAAILTAIQSQASSK